MIRILIADDHPVVRAGLVAIIQTQSDMTVVAETSNGRETVEAVQRYRPNVVLMDLIMPEMSGLLATEQITKKFSDVQVIILTSFHGDDDIYRALQAGAKTYILKDTPRNELLDTIRAVHSGRRPIPKEVASRLAQRIPVSELTPREMDVLKLIVKGLSNKEIAAALQITEGTVKGHVNIILTKLGVSDRTQAATTALQRGILHLD